MIILLLTCSLGAEDFSALDRYIDQALTNNLTIKQIQQRISVQHAARREAYLRFYPTFNFESRYSYSGGGRKIVIDPSQFITGNLPPGFELGGAKTVDFLRETEHDTRFSLLQPLFTGGMIRNSYNASEMKYRSAKSELESQKEQIIETMARGYYNYLMTLRLVSVSESNLTLAKEHQQVARSLFEAERVSQAEVYRAEVAVARAEQALSEANQNVVLAKAYFNKLLDRSMNDSIEVTLVKQENSQISLPLNELQDVSSYLKLAEQNRPELEVVRYGRSSLEYLRKVRKAEYYPQLSLAATYGWQAEKLKFDFPHDYWTISLLLKFNIFDWGARSEQIRQVDAQIHNIDYQYRDLVRGVELQVTEAYQSLLTLSEKWTAAKKQLQSARENLRITEVQYGQGLASQITYLDAQNEMTRAWANLIIVYYEYLSAQATLDLACGIGRENYRQ